MFLEKFKNMFLTFLKNSFFNFRNVFVLLMSCFFALVNNINLQNYKYDLFLTGRLRSAVFDLDIQYISVFSLYKW